MRARLWLLFALLVPGAGAAGEVLRADVAHRDGTYTVALAMRIGATAAAVHAVLTDYAHLDRLNEAIRSSTVLSADNPRYRVRIVTGTCVLMFCSEMIQTQDITHLADHAIRVRLVPDSENFRAGSIRWRIENEAGAARMSRVTRVTMDASFTPAFWVPPLIGPALLKRKLRNDALDTVANLERLAQPWARP